MINYDFTGLPERGTLIRTLILQAILDAIDGRTYLEIGVDGCENFNAVKAKRKLGVDVHLDFLSKNPFEKFLQKKKLQLRKERFFEQASDIFFQTQRSLFEKYKIDVAFVDGFHTF
ncbi:MAG: hypothetical protein NTW09_03340, partial [Candidatus Omnitrophica bacterium]|nr:hypothetical protein [Candidatus Omnitrophota bacterium]